MNTITQMQLTQKLLAMAAICAAGLPQRKTKAHPRFNNLRTVNNYGYQSVQDEIVEFIQDRLCCEVGNGQA